MIQIGEIIEKNDTETRKDEKIDVVHAAGRPSQVTPNDLAKLTYTEHTTMNHEKFTK